MKRLALLLLVLTMVFVGASAEEQFVEENFATAASFDDEFFAEESFFSDAFGFEQPELESEILPELEGEIEDRSVYLFEAEEDLRGDDIDLLGWQKWDIKNLTSTAGNKGKVTLSWSLAKGGDVPPTLPETTEAPTTKEIKAQKGVKVYIYQVDATTGVPTQLGKPVAITKNNTTVTVKTSGTFTYFARLEKVDKEGNELLGRQSDATSVTIALNDKAVTNVKVFYANASEQPDGQDRAQPVVTISVDIYAKELDSSYTIDVAQKKGALGTATYKPDPDDLESVKAELQAKGFVSVNLYDNPDVTWSNDTAPKLEANGNAITVAVNSSVSKVKKGSVTPKKITTATQPVITSAVQIDPTHVYVTWYDDADVSKVNPATSYTIAAGKAANTKNVNKDDLIANDDDSYSYNFEVLANTNANNKDKNIQITVQSNAPKAKKSKAFKVPLKAIGKGAILNLSSEQINGDVRVMWNGTVSAAYEVYATDSVHTDEVMVEGKILTGQADQDEDGPKATTYYAVFSAADLAVLNQSKNWTFTVKAKNATYVIAREVVHINNESSGQAPKTIIVDADTTLEQAVAKANKGDTIQLAANVTLNSQVTIDKKLTLDLNGKKIESTGRAFIVSGNLTVTGNGGEITSENDAAIELDDSGRLTIEGGTVNAKECAVFIAGKDGTVYIKGGTFNVTDNAAIMDNGKAGLSVNNTINISGGTFNCGIATSEYSACGIYAANNNTWNITGGTFNVTNGAGIVARAGTVKMSANVVITTTGSATGYVGDSKVKMPSAAIVFDSQSKYPALKDSSVIEISGGQFTSAVDAVQIVRAGSDLNKRVMISGGSFSSDVSAYCEEGHEAVKEGNVWVVR